MNRKEFQKWLDQFPEDTIIQVGVQSTGSMYESYGPVFFEELLPGKRVEDLKLFYHDQCEYVDFNGSPFIKPTHIWYNKRFLKLGESR